MKISSSDRFGIFKVVGLLIIFLVSAGLVHGGTEGVLTYEINGGTVEITDCDTGASGSLVIPSQIEGWLVTAIGGWAFSFCQNLVNISIPDSVITIDSFALAYASALVSITVGEGNAYYTSIDGVLFNKNVTVLVQYPGGKPGSYTLPESVLSISDWAFYYCNNLTGVVIPSGVSSIGNYAFRYCNLLVSIDVEAGNSYYSSIDGVFFNQGQTTLIQYPPGKVGAYVLPDSVVRIENYAFYSCDGLTSVSLPESLSTIGYHAFYSCDGLTSVSLSGGLSSIGNRAFAYCNNLLSITVEEGSLYYRSVDGVLFNVAVTTLIQYPAGKVGAYVLPDSVVRIEDYAFYFCDGLTSVSLPESLSTIGDYAFYSCDGLTRVIIPEGVTSLGRSAFRFNNRLGKVIFMGNAPFLADEMVFSNAASGFTVYYYTGNSGFSSPVWQGYPAQALSVKNTEAVILWLDNYGYPIDTEMGNQDQNGDVQS